MNVRYYRQDTGDIPDQPGEGNRVSVRAGTDSYTTSTMHRLDLRLPPAAYRRLQQLAHQDGTTPGTTAKRLVVRGVLRELRTLAETGTPPGGDAA